MTPFSFNLRCHFRAAALLAAGLLALPGISAAVGSSAENGLRLLQAELPREVPLGRANCEQLAAAVGKATLAHPPDAPTILRAALTRGSRKSRRADDKLPCACARRILSVSVAAAPTQASELLDMATELYPTCATELAGALRDYDRMSYDYKDRVIDDKNGPARDPQDLSEPDGVRQISNRLTGDPANPSLDPGDLSAHDISGLGFSDAFGFGSGFGPGFSGSPGFIGSVPDGGLALPPTSVTSVVNG